MSKLDITIVGAGISGLTLALQLHALGFHGVKIYEPSKKLKPLGVGLNLQPSAVLVFRNVGLLSQLEANAISCRELVFYDQHGNKILAEARGIAADYDITQLSIHRGRLQMLLLEAVRERLGYGAVMLDPTLESFEQDSELVTACFRTSHSERMTVQTAVLVGADGINSAVRSALYPAEGPPKFSERML